MIKEYLKIDQDNIIFDGSYMECYIPEYYFDSKYSENFGNSIRTLGVFSARAFLKDKPMKLETVAVPTMIDIFPSHMEKKELILVEGRLPKPYYICKFYKGDVLMKKHTIPNSTNVEIFLNMILRGKVIDTIKYSQVIDLWHKNLKLNNMSLGTTSTVLETIIAEIYRNKNKPEEKFGKYIGINPTASQYDYIPANIREICSRNSTFAALTFEDMDAMITTSLNINKLNKEQTQSPIENIIKM